MSKKPKYAYTGILPPRALLKKIPNWRDALDLEGVAGCDESTIQPHQETKVIPADASFSAITLTLADGEVLNGLADVQARHASAVRVYAAKGEVGFPFFLRERRWDVAGFVARAFPKKKIAVLFPALLELDLPWAEDGHRSSYLIFRDGSCRPLQRSAHKGFIKFEDA